MGALPKRFMLTVVVLLLWPALAAHGLPSGVLDLSAAAGSTYTCGKGAECWTRGDHSSGWTVGDAAARSPVIAVGDGATVVVRLRTSSTVTCDWSSGPGSARVLERVEPTKPWSFQVAAVSLPAGETGSLRCSPEVPSGRSRAVFEVSFAEVLRHGHGRCYRDSYRAATGLLDAVICVPPAQAKLTTRPAGISSLHVALASTARPSRAALRVALQQGGRTQEISRLTPAQGDGWVEQRLTLPATPAAARAATSTLRFSVDGPPDELLVWAPRIGRAADAEHPSVLVYLVDTLRADAVGVYGAGAATPHFDALARQGAVFEDAVAPSSWTLPSVVSLFTGRDALSHGVVYDRDVLSPDIRTLAEHFRAAGYATAAVTASPWVSDRYSTQRGFQELVDISPGRGRWGIAAGTSSAAATRIVAAWLEQHAGDAFFLYVHVIDPHQPYTPPPELEKAFVKADWGVDDRRWRIAHAPSNRHPRPGNLPGRGRSLIEQMPPAAAQPIIAVARELYDAAVAHCDGQLGDVLAELDRLRLRDRTVVALVADHGEEFLEHGMTGHAHSLYAEITHIPFLLSAPADVTPGLRVRQTVGLIDVAPTLLGLAHLPADPSMNGRDLRPLLHDPAERLAPRALRLLHRSQSRGVPIEGVPDMEGVVTPQWKLIHNHPSPPTARPEYQIFDRLADPGETTNVAAKHPEIVDRLRAVVETMPPVDSGRSAPGKAAPLDPATRERLRALGYSAD